MGFSGFDESEHPRDGRGRFAKKSSLRKKMSKGRQRTKKTKNNAVRIASKAASWVGDIFDEEWRKETGKIVHGWLIVETAKVASHILRKALRIP